MYVVAREFLFTFSVLKMLRSKVIVRGINV